MKRLSLILVLLLASSFVHAATWYATSSTVNINAAGLWVPTQGASCAGSGTALTWGAQATGDVFNANGCTAIAVNVDPGGVSVQVTLTTDTTNGGGFTLTMANLGTIGTIHAHILATKTTVLVVSGTTSSGTISGNVTGGNAASAFGISTTHTTGTLTIVGNILGGSATSAFGLTVTNGGSVVVTGNATAGTIANTHGFNASSSTTITMTGNCVGSDTVSAYGCASTGSGVFTLTGNLINGKRGSAMSGGVIYTPASTNYILSPKDASYTLGTIDTHATEVPAAPAVSNVKLSIAYGSFTGTLVTTGGSCASAQGWR